MPVFQLPDLLLFPPTHLAEPDGLLAVGGDLSPQRLLLAYSSGIFPWFNEGDPLLWWSPDPRFIIEPRAIHVSRSLDKVIRRNAFTVTVNRAFAAVMMACGPDREGDTGTWITEEMLAAYGQLHGLGFAHSVECWQEDELVGGLYGICLGRCFFGESMFHRRSDASKVALVFLAGLLAKQNFEMIDCQLPTRHLASLGGRSISRTEYLSRLHRAGVQPSVVSEPEPFPL